MYTRAIHNSKLGKLVVVRPLADGDTQTITTLFDRLSDASRASRFHGAKPRLTEEETATFAKVGPNSHVLVAYVDADPLPAGLARLARDRSDPRTAEIAFEVADCYQGAGIGTALVELLVADARAAGFSRLEALVEITNRSALRLARRVLAQATTSFEDGVACISAAVR
jgi:RimJ/RimL family protein N-acetyltransferase